MEIWSRCIFEGMARLASDGVLVLCLEYGILVASRSDCYRVLRVLNMFVSAHTSTCSSRPLDSLSLCRASLSSP